MTASHDTFWWLLVLIGLFVAVFAGLLWWRLTREADRERRTEERRRRDGPG